MAPRPGSLPQQFTILAWPAYYVRWACECRSHTRLAVPFGWAEPFEEARSNEFDRGPKTDIMLQFVEDERMSIGAQPMIGEGKSSSRGANAAGRSGGARRLPIGGGRYDYSRSGAEGRSAGVRHVSLRRDHLARVLENYLDRSVTMAYFLVTGRPEGNREYLYRDDDIRLIQNIGAKFIGRAIYRWNGESLLNDPNFWTNAKALMEKVHAFDPDVIFQGCLFETISREVNSVKIPGLGVHRLRPARRGSDVLVRRHAQPGRQAGQPLGPGQRARRHEAGDATVVLLPGGLLHRPRLRGPARGAGRR